MNLHHCMAQRYSICFGSNCNMWIILLSLFLFAQGTVGEIDCEKQRYDQCQRPKLFGEFPREVDVFNAWCPDTLTYIKCTQEFDSKCEGHRKWAGPEKYAKVFAVFTEICEEGWALNEVATTNLKCFNETFSNTNCLEEVATFFESIKKDSTDDHPEWLSCLAELLLLQCIVEDINSNCGLRAREATVEFLQRVSFADDRCPSDYRESLLKDIDEFDLTREQKTFAIAELERMKIADEA